MNSKLWFFLTMLMTIIIGFESASPQGLEWRTTLWPNENTLNIDIYHRQDFGQFVEVGDVNGDGYDDVIVSCDMYIYVYEGPLPAQDGWDWASPMLRIGTRDSQYVPNFHCIALADVNNDDIMDIIIGEDYYSQSDSPWFIYVFYGKTTWTTGNDPLDLDDVNDSDWSAMSPSNRPGGYFGWSLANAGDVNSDGIDDIIVGAPQDPDNTKGKAYVYYGSDSGLPADQQPDGTIPPFGEWELTQRDITYRISGELGTAVGRDGHSSGSGFNIDNFIVGIPGADIDLNGNGYYSDTEEDIGIALIGPRWWALSGDNRHHTDFGYVLGNAGDVNGDGHPEVLVCARRWQVPPKIFLYLGTDDRVNTEGTFVSYDWSVTNIPYHMITYPQSSWKPCVGSAGDINGDGYGDIYIGDASYNPSGPYGDGNEGRVHIWYGGAPTISDPSGLGENQTPESADLILTPSDIGGNTFIAGMCITFGWDVAAGDIDGDGLTDLVIGDPDCYHPYGGTDPGVQSGAVHVFTTSDAEPPVPTDPPSVLVVLSGYDSAIPLAWAEPATAALSALGKNNVGSDHLEGLGILASTGLSGEIGMPGMQDPADEATHPMNADTQPGITPNALTGYNVYRSTNPGGPYTRIASGLTRRYYRDEPVTNGVTYYYVVAAVYTEGEGRYSVERSGRAQTDGYTIYAGWATSAPTIDGVIGGAEWSTAGTANAVYPGYNGTVTLYAMNDNGYLYLAVADQGDGILADYDSFGLLFDDDGNREWPPSANGQEGIIQLYRSSGSFSANFQDFYGWWPDNYDGGSWITPPGVMHRISASSGHVQYEARFDLSSSPLNPAPGDVIGLLIYIWETGINGFSGLWPQETVDKLTALTSGNRWAHGPFSYADVELATSPVTGEATVRIDPASKTIQLTETGTTDVVIEGVSDLGLFEFTIDYDPSIVRIAGNSDVVLGDFLGSTGRTAFEVGKVINNSSGMLTYSALSMGEGAGPDGTGVLATITWTPQDAGISALDLTDVQVGNTSNLPITTTVVDGEIIVETHFWADLDGDGDVDIFDIQIVAAHWNTKEGDPGYDPQYDFDDDGDIDTFDVMAVAMWWNKELPSAMALGMGKAVKQVPGLTIRFRRMRDGDLEIMEVAAENAANLAGIEVELVSTSRFPGIRSIQPGNAFGHPGKKTLMLGPDVSDNGSRVKLGVIGYGEGSGIEGAGVLARIVFSEEIGPFSIGDIQCLDDEGRVLDGFSVENDFEIESATRLPSKFELFQNNPNPFNSETKIRFSLPEACFTILRIYDLRGKEIETLLNERRQAGQHTVVWNAAGVPSGVYLYRLEAGNRISTKKLILQK